VPEIKILSIVGVLYPIIHFAKPGSVDGMSLRTAVVKKPNRVLKGL
jgi:hypothetical protein